MCPHSPCACEWFWTTQKGVAAAATAAPCADPQAGPSARAPPAALFWNFAATLSTLAFVVHPHLHGFHHPSSRHSERFPASRRRRRRLTRRARRGVPSAPRRAVRPRSSSGDGRSSSCARLFRGPRLTQLDTHLAQAVPRPTLLGWGRGPRIRGPGAAVVPAFARAARPSRPPQRCRCPAPFMDHAPWFAPTDPVVSAKVYPLLLFIKKCAVRGRPDRQCSNHEQN
mmetsp:Transcript_18520/g.62051  ORF Transcript_18520/g.62051 Transcript_18520/m.62051 type:complete len:226 (+) Transcript_18520:1077-1754(+)